MGLILDTNFVIAAEREARRGAVGSTDRFLALHGEESLFITFTIAGELACGNSAAARREWDRLCQPFPVLPWTLDVSWRYGEIYRELALRGRMIGTHDLWIAATALANHHAVVTNNRKEISQVPGLAVISY